MKRRPLILRVDLIVKRTANGWRIGVKYLYNYQAIRAYKELHTWGDDFELLAEPSHGTISLRLTDVNNGHVHAYNALDYKPDELKRLLEVRFPAEVFFVHVYPQHNALFVGRAHRAAPLARIHSLTVNLPENF